ncbi:MAG: AAA family ATPase [Planctomycetota bacterium]
MRTVITGQVGVDKKPFLQAVARIARDHGHDLTLCNVGDQMYAEAPDVAPGRILDLPLSRLTGLRRSVFKDILNTCNQHPNVLINTHATFRWRHGLFYAFDYDLMKSLDADLYVVVLDNIDRVHRRLIEDGHTDHSLKDLMVWREEETLATELVSQIVRGHGCFYIVSRGFDDSTAEAMVRLMFEPQRKKAYLSFPMTHVVNMPDTLAEIERFRKQLKSYFTCFDPADLEEKYLTGVALEAAEHGQRSVEIGPANERVTVDVAQLVDIIPDVDGQIYARDFKLIDQSDMIISLIPEMADGRPGLSSGVERELQHAYESTKDVFVIWKPASEPSPFITETATRVFRSVQEAVDFFHDGDYVLAPPKGSLFAD